MNIQKMMQQAQAIQSEMQEELAAMRLRLGPGSYSAFLGDPTPSVRVRRRYFERAIEQVNAFPAKREDFSDPHARLNRHRHYQTARSHKDCQQQPDLRRRIERRSFFVSASRMRMP